MHEGVEVTWESWGTESALWWQQLSASGCAATAWAKLGWRNRALACCTGPVLGWGGDNEFGGCTGKQRQPGSTEQAVGGPQSTGCCGVWAVTAWRWIIFKTWGILNRVSATSLLPFQVIPTQLSKFRNKLLCSFQWTDGVPWPSSCSHAGSGKCPVPAVTTGLASCGATAACHHQPSSGTRHARTQGRGGQVPSVFWPLFSWRQKPPGLQEERGSTELPSSRAAAGTHVQQWAGYQLGACPVPHRRAGCWRGGRPCPGLAYMALQEQGGEQTAT